MLRKYLPTLIAVLFCMLPASISAYDFSQDRKDLLDLLGDSGYDPAKIKISTLFETVDRDNLKHRTNLLKLKGELAKEMLSSFQVADPVIVKAVLDKNSWSEIEVRNDKNKINTICGDTSAGFLLFVKIVGSRDTILINYELVDITGRKIARIDSIHDLEKRPEPVESTYSSTESGGGSSSSRGRFGSVFPLAAFNRSQNYSYGHFLHTGILIPDNQSLRFALWFKDVQDVDIIVRHFRYDLRYKLFQLGFNSEGTLDGTHRFSKVYVKAGLIQEETFNIPLFVSIGLLQSFYRMKDDPYLFILGNEEETDKNEKLANTSLMFSMNYVVDSVGLTLGFSWHNVGASIQSRLQLHQKLNFMFDYHRTTIENEIEKDDFNASIELYPVDGVSFSLGYQYETEQTTLGTGINF